MAVLYNCIAWSCLSPQRVYQCLEMKQREYHASFWQSGECFEREKHLENSLMRRIILYIATSIDGYIATPDGGVEWLDEIPNPNKTDHGYNALLDSIDTVLMGGRTYHEIIGFGVEWPYKNKITYVVSRRNSNVTPNEDVYFITEDIVSKISELKNETGKDIWLVGGGELTTILLNANLIDEMQLCIAPIILGQGIPLFPNKPKESLWTLKDNKTYDTGMITATYTRK